MNKEWSEQNKRMQSLIKKADTFNDLKIKVMNERREELKALSVVSSDENAVWLIDYWCNKDLRGLISVFVFCLERLENTTIQIVVFILVIFGEIAWVVMEDSVMKKKMIKK